MVVNTLKKEGVKSDMADDEFRAMVLQLAKRFSGGEFDEGMFNLKHWKR